VRSRSHLDEIIPLLQAYGLKYQANDIESLSHRMVIRDLMSLTKALWHIGDRLAWLSILRAPWCGLTLADLHAIASDHDAIIWDKLKNFETIVQLSEDAQSRLSFVVPIFNDALQSIRKIPFKNSVETTWLQLGGPATIDDESDLINAEHYFNLLAELDDGGDIIHFNDLNRRVKKLFASPDPDADETLQIMSIHKSKGLEFDTVILPGMNKRSGIDSSKLLTWLERPRELQDADLILAPIKHATHESDPIYQYCQHVDAKKAELETVRLLYVAATRAKSELHLFGCIQSDDKGEIVSPAKKSFLYYLWSTVIPAEAGIHMPEPFPNAQNKEHAQIRSVIPARLLRQGFAGHEAGIHIPESFPNAQNNTFAQNEYDSSASTGTLIHEILQKISIEGLNNYPLWVVYHPSLPHGGELLDWAPACAGVTTKLPLCDTLTRGERINHLEYHLVHDL